MNSRIGLDRAAFNQTAAGVLIGHDDDARRIQDLRCLRHEPDAAERDDIAFGLARLAGQFQAVADHVGKFLNLGILIMMREQNGAAIALEIENFFREGCGRGNHNRERDCVFMVSTV